MWHSVKKISGLKPNAVTNFDDYIEIDEIKMRPSRLHMLGKSAIPTGIGVVIIMFANLVDGLHPVDKVESPARVIDLLKSQTFYLHVMIEVGIAFMIAGIVAFFIEASARAEQSRQFDEAIRMIGNEVIHGVYGVRHDKNYVRSVVSACLAIRHIRINYVINCFISEFSEDECREYGIKNRSLIKFIADIKYDSKNLGNKSAVFDGRYYIPKRKGLTDKDFCVDFLEVGSKKYNIEEIDAIEIKPDDPLYVESEKGYRFNIPTNPNSTTRVHLKAVFAKERSDNEIFAFLLPTVGAIIRFDSEIKGLRIGASARAATPLEAPDVKLPNRSLEWTVSGSLLPNNHITVWWQEGVGSESTDDGVPASPLEAPP